MAEEWSYFIVKLNTNFIKLVEEVDDLLCWSQNWNHEHYGTMGIYGTMSIISGNMSIIGGTMRIYGTMSIIGGTMCIYGTMSIRNHGIYGTMNIIGDNTNVISGTMSIIGATTSIIGGTMHIYGTMRIVGGTISFSCGTICISSWECVGGEVNLGLKYFRFCSFGICHILP